MEVETFIPMVLQAVDAATGKSRLKRVVLIGDHHQLPPVVKHQAFQKYARLDQSMFAPPRVPDAQLDACPPCSSNGHVADRHHALGRLRAASTACGTI